MSTHPNATRPARSAPLQLVLLALALIALAPLSACAAPRAPRLEGLGAHSLAVSTRSAAAQRFFDQGLRLAYAFNHAEARRAFQEAQRLDASCAMAHWGEALALGPNINAPMSPEAEADARSALARARARDSSASALERGLIAALELRFAEGSERADADASYLEAMVQLAARHPEHADVGTLRVAAFMETRPWDYWDQDGTPRPGTLEALAAIERTLAQHPQHAGAIHYYIHLVEAARPELAVAAADRLGPLMPGAGHMVHMPSHIYMRVGRYADASRANIEAIAADEDYLAQCSAQGLYPAMYYPHNIHFLWSAATMEGRSELALASALKVRDTVRGGGCCAASELSGQDWLSTLLFAQVRFGRWQDVLATPEPAADQLYARALWHYARGLALAAQHGARTDAPASASMKATATSAERAVALADEAIAATASSSPEAADAAPLARAEHELERLRELAQHASLAEATINFSPARSVLGIAESSLSAEIDARRGEVDSAVAALRRAVELEDGLRYMEPPTWHLPVRQHLGAILLEAGRAAEAEAAYLEDLADWRENGWSLFGLWQSLAAQGKAEAAAEAARRFRIAWVAADFPITGSVVR
jgi:hypothetical protein